MPQHYPYPPAYHGNYYYRPYNYCHVLDHKQHLLGNLSITPYSSTVFERLYADTPRSPFNPDQAANPADPLIPPAPEKLPKLEDLLDNGSDG